MCWLCCGEEIAAWDDEVINLAGYMPSGVTEECMALGSKRHMEVDVEEGHCAAHFSPNRSSIGVGRERKAGPGSIHMREPPGTPRVAESHLRSYALL